MMRLPLILSALLLCSTTLANPESLRKEFIARMVSEHGFDAAALQDLLAKAEVRQSILDAIARPAEKRLNWGQYRKIFLTPERVRGGLEYWRKNEQTLARAQEEYGVPPEIIVAIIGVETRYGRHAGSYPVLDALSTLGFHYPPRAGFFRRELEQFLLLARQEGMDPTKPLGSYAGAMGRPQFIPSSYRSYAIDFDQDGKRDIWDDDADVIGSVANYFARHGWRQGQTVTRRVHGVKDVPGEMIQADGKPDRPVSAFAAQGIPADPDLPPDAPAALLALQTDQGTQYWLALTNFYVITRYNHSPLYAMAVYQLADAIKRLHNREADD
jgi:membrane-bound lytic murein transglycosylase B